MDSLSLIIVVVTALAFDFTNGFHDTANMVATSISTRAVSPKLAVLIAAIMNFVGAFLSIKVAATIGKGIVDSGSVTQEIVFAGLIGAIAWNILTWYFGLPSSSSHALIGGVVGAMLAAVGLSGVNIGGLANKVILPGFIAPVVAFLAAGIVIALLYRIFAKTRPSHAIRGFRLGQLPTSILLSLAHGTNDAQKTMGVIVLALVANGVMSSSNFYVPTWVIFSSATAIALGTYVGGWRIIKTMGSRIIKMDSAQGFAAQGMGALVILGSSQLGYPLSTTHVMSGSIIGAGAAKRLSAVRWGVAGNILIAWLLTIPGAGLVGALVYNLIKLIGNNTVGIVIVGFLGVVILAAVFARRAIVSGRIWASSKSLRTKHNK